MIIQDLIFQTACELAQTIRDRAASAEEIVKAHLRHSARHNRSLNAVVTLDEAGARHRAREADEALARGEVWGPLHGVPVTIKDCFETAGMKTTAGFPPLEDHVPAKDATVVARMRNAGAIVLGKTILSLLATDWQTDNPVFGRTNNPWDRSRTPGGSSGGSGAAVAACLSPLDVGSDIGGSIRVPAHFNGVYGFKPTEHRVPSTGHIPDWHVPGKTLPGSVRHMGVYGPLARSVADLVLSFSILAGPDGSQPEVPPLPSERESVPPPVKELHIAWSDRLGGLTPSAETRATLEKIASTLKRNGARVERLEPEIDFDSLWRTWGEIAGAEIGGLLPFMLRNMFWLQFLFMRDRSPIREGILGGIRMDWRKLAEALARRDETIRRMDALIEPYDAWFCPVTPGTAFAHRKPGKPVEVVDQEIPYFLAAGGYTTPFNVSGQPVVVMPVGHTEEGLPLGVQVAGHRWKDERLLAVASSLDELVGDLRHPPDYSDQDEAARNELQNGGRNA